MSTEEFLLLPFQEVSVAFPLQTLVTARHVALFIDFWWFYTCFLQVDELISNTLLNVDMEEKVYTSVINWVKHEPSERKKYVARVRFSDT